MARMNAPTKTRDSRYIVAENLRKIFEARPRGDAARIAETLGYANQSPISKLMDDEVERNPDCQKIQRLGEALGIDYWEIYRPGFGDEYAESVFS